MSFLTAPAVTTSTGAGSSGFSFGGPTSATTSSGPTTGVQLGGFTFASTAPPTASSTTTSVPGLGQTSTAAPTTGFLGLGGGGQAASSTAASAAASTTGPGLGGFALSASSGNGVGAAQNGVAGAQKPRDTQLPPQMQSVVDALRKQIKSNKENSDEISATSISHVRSLNEEITNNTQYLVTVGNKLQKLVANAERLKEQSRHDLRQAELVQRRNEAIPAHQYGNLTALELEPIWHLHTLAGSYEEKLLMYQNQLRQIEELIIERQRMAAGENTADVQNQNRATKADMIVHLKRMEEAIRQIGSQVYRNHDYVDDVKVQFMRYRRALHGENVPNPFAAPVKSSTVGSGRQKNLAGPDPFTSDPYSSLLGMANAMSRNRSALPVATGLYGPPQGSLSLGSFSAPPSGTRNLGLFGSTGFGWNQTGGQTGLNNSSVSTMFRPFGSGNSTVSTAMTPSLGSAFGSVPATSAMASNSPFRFSSSFSNASSGTLFGGSAATGVVKPFGR